MCNCPADLTLRLSGKHSCTKSYGSAQLFIFILKHFFFFFRILGHAVFFLGVLVSFSEEGRPRGFVGSDINFSLPHSGLVH